MKSTQELARLTKCRYLKTTNTIKSSNFSMNLTTLDAYSYDWWMFCTKLNGKIIINQTMYSSSTLKHQSKVMQVLDYKYDLKLNYTMKSLVNLYLAFSDEVDGSKRAIEILISDIKKPRSHKAKNKERKESIGNLISHIGHVRSFKVV
jgi:curved DNA-binding protein CbpA